MEPIDDSPGTSNHPEQHVQNAVISAVGTESNLSDWCLAAEAINESKEGIARIDSSQPSADKSTEEYILGGDSEEKCVNTFIQTVSADSNTNNHPQENTQYSICNDSATPLPTSNMASLQSLCAITEHMQSIETQTMELYNRKMQIDAMFMTLQAERMDIDQQLKRLHNIRSEQINYIRLNLLELSSSSSNRSGGSTMQANQSFAATTS
uniref:Uncharacterized protein n=1 Tax=Anopheles maculatus TaxID=74869 RepID=A0A182SLK1_9DIPT